MMFRTHILLGLVLALVFLPVVSVKGVFVLAVLLGSVLPDADLGNSSLGKFRIFRPLQILVKHRGLFHSVTSCALISLVFAFVLPLWSFGVFLGFAGHLVLDSFTPEGVRPFWPLRGVVKGPIRTESVGEKGVWVSLLVVLVLLGLRLVL
jgi:membrane-bound metal-dependent hydrolase YbcI (DUF457 family)